MSDAANYKISGLEACFWVSFCLFFDILDALATLLDGFMGIGEILKLIINVVASSILWLWSIIKGVRATWLLAGMMLEFIPFIVNLLPLRTATMIITIYLDWHPKVAGVAKMK